MPAQTMFRPRSITQDVYERLRADILACRLLPGCKLHINELCVSLGGVSLGAVREALSRLAADKLTIAEPQRGFTVAGVSPRDLEELTEARIKVETWSLRAAIVRGGVRWEAAIAAAFQKLSTTPFHAQGDPESLSDAWVAAHSVFHEALVSAAGNSWLLRMREQLYNQSERYRRLSVPAVPLPRDVEGEHLAIMEAALARNADAAATRLTEHLQLTTRILLTADFLLGAAPSISREARRKVQGGNIVHQQVDPPISIERRTRTRSPLRTAAQAAHLPAGQLGHEK